MRKFTLFSLWLTMPLAVLMGQSTSYLPIFTKQTQWNLFMLRNGAIEMGFQKVTKDTLIGGQFFAAFAADATQPHINTAYIYEDIPEKKVYVMENGDTRLLYDFTLQKGDIFQFKEDKFEVIAVGNAATREGTVVQITLRCLTKLSDFLVWVEGVGATSAPLYYKHFGNQTEEVKVKCFFRQSQLIYSLSDETCPLPVPTFESKNIDNIQVTTFPNPMLDELNIDIKNPNNHPLEVELFSISGVSLKNQILLPEADNLQLHWDMQHIERGMYLLKIRSINGQITKKIIKS
jgi:hypothetical protein